MKRMEGSMLKRFVWAKKEVRAEKVKVAPNAGDDFLILKIIEVTKKGNLNLM